MSGEGASDFGCGNRPSGEEARDHGGQRFERSKRRSGGFTGTEDVRGSERGRVGPWGAGGAQLGRGPELPLDAGGLPRPQLRSTRSNLSEGRPSQQD